MYEESCCFDHNPTVEAIIDNNDNFFDSPAPETTFPVSHQLQPPLVIVDSFNDDGLKLPTMEEFSIFHNSPQEMISFPNSETQNQINNNHLINQMIQDSNWSLTADNNSGFFINTLDPNTTPPQIPDLLSLLHLPRSSISLPRPDISNLTSGSCFTHDRLLHLNFPPQPPFIPTNTDYSGFLLGIDHTNGTTQRDLETSGEILYNDGNNLENNNAQFDSGILEFSKEIRRKGRGKGKNKPFTTERERRCHLNERYEALKSLIPSPSKGDRASILQDGIDYINELRRRVSELKYLVERKRSGGRRKNYPQDDHSNNDDGDEEMEKMPESDVIDQCSSNNSLRCSWLQRKSKVTEVDVRIVDDEVTIKIVQKKKINCLLFVSRVLDQLHLDLHHVAGGQIGEHYSFLFNTKICEEGSTIYASAIANKVIEVVDQHYMTTLPINNNYY